MRRQRPTLSRAEAEAFIRQRLRQQPVPISPEIVLYQAHRGSGLAQLAEIGDGAAPYWAFRWAGGMVLVRHLMAHPEVVAGKRVLDLGSGSGLVAIAAMKAGAARVLAAEIDPLAQSAIRLNAEANEVVVEIVAADLTGGGAPAVDVVLGGDVFYDAGVGARMLPFLERCAAAGTEVLVGDPGRTDLPRERLTAIADYRVADMGDAPDAEGRAAQVFTLRC